MITLFLAALLAVPPTEIEFVDVTPTPKVMPCLCAMSFAGCRCGGIGCPCDHQAQAKPVAWIMAKPPAIKRPTPLAPTVYYLTDRYGKTWSSPDWIWLQTWVHQVGSVPGAMYPALGGFTGGCAGGRCGR